MASTFWVYGKNSVFPEHIYNVPRLLNVLTMYLPCVFNFPSLVHCKDVASTFWMNWSGKCWSNWVGTMQMDSKCPNLVCDSHMTWYIARDIQNKPPKHILMAFAGIFKISWSISSLGHCGHMTWYILNISDTIPSQDIAAASVWYI